MLYMKNIKLSILAVVTIVCMLLATDTLQATHVVGGDLYYQCLGNNNYRITFEMRRDCFNGAADAEFDDPARIAVYDGEGNLVQSIGRFGQIQIPFSSSDTLNEILTSECQVFGEDVCVHTTTYEKIVNLPFSETGYVLVYQRCCRNNTLNNIIEPLEQGATYSVELTPESMRLCNSTPQFIDWPDIYLCNNDWYRFDHSAIDIDGDSLVYELCAPSVGGTIDDPSPNPAFAPPHGQVVWAPPYNLSNMMGGVSPLRIDAETGMLSVRPDVIGQFLIGVCVKEYRDGELLSVVRRDFEFNTRLCNDSPRANFTAQPSPNCDGLEVSFTNNSTSDRDYLWYFDYDGDRSLTSTQENPDFTYSTSGLYRVRLEVTDGECLDIFRQNIGVSARGDIAPDFEITSSSCDGDFKFKFTDKTVTSQRITAREWQIDYGGFTVRKDRPEFTIRLPKEDRTAVISYSVTGESGCVETITRSVDLHFLETSLVDTDITICKGSSTELIDLVDEDFEYNWSPTQGLDLSDPRRPIASPTSSTSYVLSLSDGVCNLQIDVPVTVDDDNDIIVTGADVACNGIVTLEASSDGTRKFEWFEDAEYTISLGTSNPINLIIADIPDIIYVRSGEDKACNFLEIDLSDILVTDDIGLEITNNEAIPLCEGDEVVLSASTRLSADFTWFNENGTVVGTGPNVTILPRNNEVFTVVATDANGCEEMASFETTIANEIDLSLSIDENEIDRCFGDQLDVTANSTSEVTIKWFENNVMVADGPRLIMPLTESGIFRAVATDEFGCSTSEELIVNVAEEIEYTLNEGDRRVEFCFYETFDLIANSDDPDIRFIWYDADDNVIHRGERLQLDADDAGEIRLEARNEFNCSIEETIEVIVPESFDLDFGIDVVDDRIETCFGEEISITASTIDGVDVEWFENGDRIQRGSNLQITPPVSTVYTVVGTDDAGCEVSKDLEIIVFEDLDYTVNTNDGDGVNYCFGESYTLTATGTDDLSYEWFDIDNTSLGRGAELLLDGELDQIVKLVVTDENGCIEEQIINVNVFDDFTIAFDSEEVIYCPSEPANLSITSDVDITVIWFDADGNAVGTGADFSYQTAEATTLTAVVFSPDGCTKEQAFMLSPLTIEYINPESITLCAGESVTIEFLDNSITTPLTFDWDNKEAVSNFEPIGNLTVNPTTTTTFTVTATSSNGCEYISSTEVVVNDFAETLMVTADPEKIAVGQETQLEVDDIIGYEYEWSQPETLDDPTIPNPIATPVDANGTYTVTVTDQNGCTATASITVEVVEAVCDESDVWLPNMFTPNGDGSNDVFKAESNFVDVFEMIIYNRWGEQIFITNNLETGWNGTFKGEELEPDVYGYCIKATCINGVEYVTQGNVTIVK